MILADSHQNALEGIRGLLETVFDTVMMVADKKSLLEAVEKVKPALAVVDLSLKVSGEVNIARELNERYPDLKFIILSFHDDPSVAQSIIEMGAAGFVLKRSVATDLFSAVQEVSEGRIYVSPGLKG